MKRRSEIARIAKVQPTREEREFVQRRIEPFLFDGFSVSRRSMSTLLGEAYLQGMRDALQAQEVDHV